MPKVSVVAISKPELLSEIIFMVALSMVGGVLEPVTTPNHPANPGLTVNADAE
jgi:hypothetical protein